MRRTIPALVSVAVVACAGLLVLRTDRGVDQVEVPTGPPPVLPADCPSTPGMLDCMKPLIVDILEAHGPGAAAAALKARFDNGAAEYVSCHVVAHTLGWTAGVKYLDAVDLLKYEPGVCLEGYTHGMLEGFAKAASDDQFWEQIPKLCTTFAPGSLDLGRCTHGVGHALAVRRFGDFVETTNRCAVMHSTEAADGCAVAVQMSFSNTESDQSGALRPPEDRPTPTEIPNLCARLDAAFQTACWGGLWQFYDSTMRYDQIAPTLAPTCAAAGGFAGRCFQGLGFASFNRVPSDAIDAASLYADAAAAIDRCRADAGVHLGDCAAGVAYASANRWANMTNSMDGYRSPCDDLTEPAVTRCREGEAMLIEWFR